MNAAALTPRQEAEFEQGRGSDPAASAWVTASAGSGKTKVLTDRVLRLLLAPDARPNAILCLTFTKAAAAEMQARLARDLGRWAVASEAELAKDLATLLRRAPARADLEAAMALEGAFEGVPAAPVRALSYWKLTGGQEPGEQREMVTEPEDVERLALDSLGKLGTLVDRFLLGDAPFTARPHPLRATRGRDYDHLSRVAEWADAEDDE